MVAQYEQAIETRANKYPDFERVAAFQETLATLAICPLTVEVDPATRQPDVAAREVFFATDFQPEPTFYVHPEVAEDLANGVIGFEPFVSRGGKASGNGVFFGALTLHDGSEIHVAVKPKFSNDNDTSSRRDAERQVLKDYFMNVAAKECGFESLKPVGFILNDKGEQYSLTLLDETLTTLDSIDWTPFFKEAYGNIGMKEILYKVALLTASVHNNGDSYQGDLAPRNIANNIYGQVFFIDLEQGNFTNAPAADAEERFGKSWVDLKTLMQSMVKPYYGNNPGIGMFDQCKGDWWQNFKDVFFDDYVATRRLLAQQGSHHMPRMRDTEDELVQLEHALRMEMSRWQPRQDAEQQAA